MKKASIFVSALILFISCNVFSPEERNVTLKIRGVVSDAINGSPVSNIEVSLIKMFSPSLTDDYDEDELLDSDITSEDGFYYLESPPVDFFMFRERQYPEENLAFGTTSDV